MMRSKPEDLFNIIIVSGIVLLEIIHWVQYFPLRAALGLWVCCCISRILGYIALAGGIRAPITQHLKPHTSHLAYHYDGAEWSVITPATPSHSQAKWGLHNRGEFLVTEITSWVSELCNLKWEVGPGKGELPTILFIIYEDFWYWSLPPGF